MDGCEEVPGGFVVTRGDGAELLELAEEVLDQMTRLVERLVVLALGYAIGLGRDHRALAGGGERFDDPGVGVVRLVGEQGVGGERRQEGVGAEQVVCLARRQQEADRVAQRVDQGVDLGAQPTLAAADRLVLAVFLGAPALC